MPWNDESIDKEIVELRRIRSDIEARALPQRLYEEFVQTYKKISTEFVIFDLQGRIWLTQRPSRDKQPYEPFASQWHTPGVLHNVNESIDNTWERLWRDELGSHVEFDAPQFVNIVEFSESKRGHYLALLYISRYRRGRFVSPTPSGFFSPSALPCPIFEPHKSVLIPEAMKAASKRGWTVA